MDIDCFAVQPFMTLQDYRNAQNFSAKLEYFVRQAQTYRQGHAALLVFPEEIATFLVLLGTGDQVLRARTSRAAMAQIGRRRAVSLVRQLWRHRLGSVTQALFLVHAAQIWAVWHGTITDLARRYAMTIVAGSALLPHLGMDPDSNNLRPQSTNLYNLSFVADPRGQVIAVTRKVNLVPTIEDHLPLCSGPIESALATFPIGGVSAAVAICYDAFHVPHSRQEPNFTSLLPRLDANGVRLVAQPSANPWRWQERWPFDQPQTARTRRQQWQEEGAAAALAPCQHIELVINPQLLMHALDWHFDGQSAIYWRRGHEVLTVAHSPHFEACPASEDLIHWLWRPSAPLDPPKGGI